MTYYAQRKAVANGVPQTPSNFYGTERAMQRQFHLFCANALSGEDFANDIDCIEWGTLESGVQECICYTKKPAPTPEPEPEPEIEEIEEP